MRTFPAILEDAGYDTAFIGKWHMGDDDTPRPGFTHWISFAGQGRYADPELNINGRRVQASGHLTDVLVGYADDFVRTAARGSRPFFLYLSHKAVHEPGDPPRRHRGTYNGARVPCSPGCDDTLEGKRALTREVPGTEPPRPGGGPLDANIRGRHRRLLAVDDGVWRLRRTLEEEGVLDQTMIVFTSDNGYFHREHAIGDKRWAYEEALRIPLIVRYPPRVRRHTRIGELVLNVDLAPTLVELAGAPVPAGMHGRSLLPLLSASRGDTTGWRGEFVAEYFNELGSRVPRWEAIRTARFKYIRYPELGRLFDELYDLTADPYELTNLAFEQSRADIRDSLVRRLDAGFDRLSR
jgi:N-acetylglucosamine-6-sulfatase